MPGIYVHIPFCRRQCNYCDFHFTVSLKNKGRIVDAITKEVQDRSSEAMDITFNTLYFGGGTPSLLKMEEIKMIVGMVFKSFHFSESPEVTLEANPDDIDAEYLKSLRNGTPVNRLSIGIQSFNDRDLKLLNRIHNSRRAIQSVELAKKEGFLNLNIDLIYAIPGLTDEDWKKNLDIFKSLDIPHLSAYELTVEPHTVFAYYRKKGKIMEKPDDEKIRQFLMLMEFAGKGGYEHYEISNYAKPGFHSAHNLGYWTGEPYLGFGPSAHSYSGITRRWNLSNNTLYLENIENHRTEYFEGEKIDQQMAYNEYVMTSLRTMWGTDTAKIKLQFGVTTYDHFMKEAGKFLETGKLVLSEDFAFLSTEGKLIADYIISELMLV